MPIVDTICNVLITLIAFYGVISWRKELKIKSAINSTTKAIILHETANEYVGEILLMKNKKVTRHELSDPNIHPNEQCYYTPQPPQYYLKILDLLTIKLFKTGNEAFIATRTSYINEIKSIIELGNIFRSNLIARHNPYEYKETVELPEDFEENLHLKHKLLIDKLSPHLHFENR